MSARCILIFSYCFSTLYEVTSSTFASTSSSTLSSSRKNLPAFETIQNACMLIIINEHHANRYRWNKKNFPCCECNYYINKIRISYWLRVSFDLISTRLFFATKQRIYEHYGHHTHIHALSSLLFSLSPSLSLMWIHLNVRWKCCPLVIKQWIWFLSCCSQFLSFFD